MLILCSPTKTMRKTKEKGLSTPQFKATSSRLLAILHAYDQEKIKKVLKINDKLAKDCVKYYQEFHEENLAIKAFAGLQFRQLTWDTLDDAAKAYAYDHIGILSGLYGYLKASDNIGIYRLDYDDNIEGKKVIEYHRKNVNAFLAEQKEPIVDLCSQEYAQIIDVDHLRIEFLESNLKAKATNSKIQRGKMLRYCIVNKITDPQLLKAYHEDDYHFCEQLSDAKKWVFVKGGKINESTGKSL